MYREVVNTCTAKLNTRNSSVITSLYSPNRLVFLIPAPVLCEVRTKSSNIMKNSFCLQTPVSRLGGLGTIPAQSMWNFGGKIYTRTGFSPSTSVFPSQYPSTNAPYSSSSACCYYQGKRPSLRTFKNNDVSEMGEHWIEEVLSPLWVYKRWIIYKHHVLLPGIQNVTLLL
jgi:hypothetical protein